MTDVGMGFCVLVYASSGSLSFSCHDIPRPLHLIFPIVHLCNSERLVVLVNGYCTHIPVVRIEIPVLYGIYVCIQLPAEVVAEIFSLTPVPSVLTAATLIS